MSILYNGHLHPDLSDTMRESKMDIVSSFDKVQTCALKSLIPKIPLACVYDVFESIQIKMSLISTLM